MIQRKRLFLTVALALLTGSLRAEDAAPTAHAAAAGKPAKPASPVKAAMKAAGALAEAGQTDAAVAAYEKIGVLKSKKAEAWRLNNEGLAYLEAPISEPDKALPLLEKAVAADDQAYAAWNNLGSAYQQTDQYEKARDAYQKSINASKAAGVSPAKAEANLQNLQPQLDKISAKSTADSASLSDGGTPADNSAPVTGGDQSK